MLDTLLMILAIRVSVDERREKEKREENIEIIENLEGTTLENKKTADLNVKRQMREGAERPLPKQLNGVPQGNSTQRMGL